MPKKSHTQGRNGAGLPAWWESRRVEAHRRFDELPMPQRKDEDWRFATIDSIRLDDFKPGRKGRPRKPNCCSAVSRPSRPLPGRFL